MDFRTSAALTKALSLSIKLGTLTLVVTLLSRARDLLVPLAFAFVLSFILAPPVRWLQRLRLPRFVAVAVVALVALGGVLSTGYVLGTQLKDLATGLTRYTESIRTKVSVLRGGQGAFSDLERAVKRVSESVERPSGDLKRADPVRIVPAELPVVERLRETLAPIAEPVGAALLVWVLCIFMLGQREDLRNRLLRLVGTSNLTLTTRALDEGTHRISRYLVDQTLINGTFGAVVSAGLWFIGVPYAALWGVVAALCRFVPYVGALASMLMPAALAFAVFPGWREVVLTISLFVGMDFATAYFLEPMIIGHRTGVSSMALLVSSLFWTWLWGPVGLVLSTPLTVSLAVLEIGRAHV